MISNAREVLEYLSKDPECLTGVIKDSFELNGSQKDKLSEYIHNFENDIYPSTSKKAKGDYLEEIAFFLFTIPKESFSIKTNVRNTSNEIDLLILLKENACLFRMDFLLGLSSPEFMIECKNYSKTIDVTWVGKFANLVHQCEVSLGIIFSKLPLTGLNKGKLTWNDGAGQTKKNFLKNSKVIINLTLEDLKKIHGGKNALVLIQEKIAEVKFDTEVHLIPE